MAFCFSGSLLRANFKYCVFLVLLLLFVANKFLLLLLQYMVFISSELKFVSFKTNCCFPERRFTEW